MCVDCQFFQNPFTSLPNPYLFPLLPPPSSMTYSIQLVLPLPTLVCSVYWNMDNLPKGHATKGNHVSFQSGQKLLIAHEVCVGLMRPSFPVLDC